MTLEEKIEAERDALPAEGLTPVTKESFAAWKEKRALIKQEELEKKIAAEEAKGKKDKSQMGFMSGKALFTYNPDLFMDAEGAVDEEEYEDDEGEETKVDKKMNGDNQEEAKEEVKVDNELF